MTWRTIKLGEVVTHRKGSIIIENDYEYKLCRVQLHIKGVVLRSNTLGSNIKTKKQQVCKSGDFLVAEMDAKVGGYGFVPEELDGAIVSSHYFLFELNKEKILPEYLEMISQLLILQDQIKAVGSTNYAAIRPINVLNWEIPICSIEKQASIVSKYVNQRQQSEGLNSELTHQLTLVKQLRQSFLREAMQGKLTADFRSAHPELIEGENSAQTLLNRIAMIRNGALARSTSKKEKQLAPISEDEIPFEIPEGWVWCRLGEIADIVRGGSPRPAGDKRYYEGSIPFLKVGDLTGYEGKYCTEYTHSIKEAGLNKTRFVEANTLMLTNSGATLGIPRICTFATTFNDGIAAFLNIDLLDKEFLFYFLREKSDFFLYQASRGQGQPNLNTDIISNTIIAFPPLSEQQAIVSKLDELMRTCDELEASIRSSQQQNEMLLREVLREALEG